MQTSKISVLPSRRSQFVLSIFCFMIATATSTGCSTLPVNSNANQIVDAVNPDVAQYQVKMESTFGGAKVYQGKLEGPMTIQDALEQSGAIKKLRNMDIDLFRKVDGSYRPLQMSAIYDAGGKTVRPETNYGLRPGDSILVGPKTENSFSKIMGTFTQ